MRSCASRSAAEALPSSSRVAEARCTGRCVCGEATVPGGGAGFGYSAASYAYGTATDDDVAVASRVVISGPHPGGAVLGRRSVAGACGAVEGGADREWSRAPVLEASTRSVVPSLGGDADGPPCDMARNQSPKLSRMSPRSYTTPVRTERTEHAPRSSK